LTGPNIRLLNIANPMYMQKLNLNENGSNLSKALPKVCLHSNVGVIARTEAKP
jgi:hypothetical protein